MQNILNRDISVNKDTGKVGIHEDKTTKGLKAKYCFRFKGKTYRFRTIEEAKNKRKELREINYYGYLH